MAGWVSALGQWLAERTEGAPTELRDRVMAWVGAATPGDSVATTLGLAGMAALDAAIDQGAARTAALDLLAADALVTLALLAQAEQDPRQLGAYARQLRMDGAARL